MHSYTQCLYFQDCNEFIAGNAIRSHSRFAALSETAVMGVVCRHENPVCFINLFHGERYLEQYACQVKPMHKCVHSIFQVIILHVYFGTTTGNISQSYIANYV